MTRKHWAEILGAIAIIFALIFLVWFLMRDDVPDDHEGAEDGLPSDVVDEPVAIPDGPVEISPLPIARTFVERFGSYSTESDYQNVEDVIALATIDFKDDLERMAIAARQSDNGLYYGVSTSILTVSTESETDELATILFTTQREEATGSPGNMSLRNQDIIITLEKVGDGWLVAGFEWL
jgi:hypothetical protein